MLLTPISIITEMLWSRVHVIVTSVLRRHKCRVRRMAAWVAHLRMRLMHLSHFLVRMVLIDVLRRLAILGERVRARRLQLVVCSLRNIVMLRVLMVCHYVFTALTLVSGLFSRGALRPEATLQLDLEASQHCHPFRFIETLHIAPSVKVSLLLIDLTQRILQLRAATGTRLRCSDSNRGVVKLRHLFQCLLLMTLSCGFVVNSAPTVLTQGLLALWAEKLAFFLCAFLANLRANVIYES